VNRGTPGCEFWTPDFGYVTDAAQKDAQEKLAHLVPHAKHITNTNSGHEIHKSSGGSSSALPRVAHSTPRPC
jgi:hypothetical protein